MEQHFSPPTELPHPPPAELQLPPPDRRQLPRVEAYLIPATNQIVQEFADLLSVVSGAASDNAITPEESRSIRKRWEQLKAVTETFVACCENGNFTALKEVPEVETH